MMQERPKSKNRRLNPIAFARLQAILFALLGLVLGIIYSFGGLVMDTLTTLELLYAAETPGLSYGTVLAFGALAGMPLIGLFIGLITGFIEALLYNIIAKMISSTMLDIEQ